MADPLIHWLFVEGHAVDVILCVMLAELVWLFRAGWRPSDAALRLAPGALILLALRGAMVGADWRLIALPLLLSFPVHIADLKRRPGGDSHRAGR